MTARPLSLTGRAARLPIVRNASLRRAALVLLIAICALLTFFPEKFRAGVSLTPSDPASLGLGGTLGQLGAVGGVFGNQAAVEVSLKVARSGYVRDIVLRGAQLEKRLGKSRLETLRWLDDEVDIRALRGGIIQFEAKLRDADLAKDVVAAYGEAVRAQLAIIARNQTAYKRQILTELVSQADGRLNEARREYDTFRLQTRYASPESAIQTTGDLIPRLEELIRFKQVELNSARQFATDDNIRVRQIRAEIQSMQQQLSDARSASPVEKGSLGELVAQSTEVERLRRELALAQSLYDNYKRFLQGTSVEDLTSTANVRILEPAYIDTERQLNLLPLSLGILLFLFGLAMEFYIARPPLEAKAAAV